MAAEMKTKMLKLAVVNKMLTFKNCTNHSVEFFHLLDLKLGKKRKTCCVLQTCCMGHVHVLLHVVHTHVEVVHIENHVEILDGISC